MIEKNKSSCLLLTNKFKKDKNKSEYKIPINRSESFIEIKRKPLAPKQISPENIQLPALDIKKPKFGCEPKVLEIKMRLK